MRILWLGNPPWSPSGYGEQAALFIPRLAALGHELAVAANFGLHGLRLEWEGHTVYPADADWGNTSLHTYAAHFQADLVLCLHDAWTLKPEMWPDVTLAAWAPVDHDPAPPQVLEKLSHHQVRPIAMSRFGEQRMRQAGLDPCYVPHGVDTRLFRPQPELRAEARQRLGLPADAFLAGMVAANKGNPTLSRKAFPQAFDAFAGFAARHNNAYLYVHTEPVPTVPGHGMDLFELRQAVGIPDGRLIFPPVEAMQMGLGRDFMAVIYQAFDVLLSPSMGEGFGIPILEAQACGVPVIVSDHSAMAELGQAGWLVHGDRMWDPVQRAFWFMPHVSWIEQALEHAYRHRADQELRRRAVVFAGAYDADRVTEECWRPTLDRLASPREVGPLNGHVTVNRRQRRELAKAAR